MLETIEVETYTDKCEDSRHQTYTTTTTQQGYTQYICITIAGSHSEEGDSLSQIPSTQALSGLQLIGEQQPSSSRTPPALLPLSSPAVNLVTTNNSLSSDAIDIGPSSPPVPRKIAEQIWKGQYVELKELLPANLGAPEPTIFDLLGKQERARTKKNITCVAEWSLCFNAFIAIVAMRQPERVNDLLAYSSTITRASIDYEDMPWLAYDTHFRKQAATNPQTRWAQLDAALWTVYFTRAQPKSRTTDNKAPDTTPTRRMYKPGDRTRPSPYPMPVCRKWNSIEGCNLPFCRYRHCCYKCNFTTHKGAHCPNVRVQQSGGMPPPFRPPPPRP